VEWSVLELTPRSDGEDPDLLIRAIRGALKNREAEVFVPAAVTQIGEDRVVHYLMDGYAFVRNPGKNLKNLDNGRYVQGVIGLVANAEIERMKVQIQQEVDQGIGVGDTVKIVSGPYRNLTATVIEDIPEEKVVQVFIKLRSKQSIVTLPRPFLQVVTRTKLSGFFSRLSSIRVWVRRAAPVILWSGRDIQGLEAASLRYGQLKAWAGRDISPISRFLHGTLTLPEADRAAERLGIPSAARPNLILSQLKRTQVLTRWVNDLGLSWTFLWFQQHRWAKRQDLEMIQTKIVELYWFEDVMDRMDRLEVDLENVAHRLAKRRKSGGAKVIQNVLVDGHNLAFRCFYAPGMSSLADKQGRPTGVILGFLRSLGALKKRFPEARLYITWDGSNERRKVMYAEYKANRVTKGPSREQVFDQVGYLRDILPKFGVWQMYNPNEEADDVIATLAKGNLKGQHNVVYTTDKDLLALITDTTLVLMPGAGSRKEVLYDAEGVENVFGVPPSRLPQLRAFCGDPSDNLPGVPRVPKKVLRSLIQAHHTIKGVYKSGLTGVSEGQYERLRLSEPQVTLNLRLMSFVDVPVTSVNPDVDVEGVARRLQQDVGINAAPILKPFEGG
jgi:5'-3' exonuclease